MVSSNMHQRYILSTALREVILTCELSYAKLQTIADQLLINLELRPLYSCLPTSLLKHDTLSKFDHINLCSDELINRNRHLTSISRDLMIILNALHVRSQEVCDNIKKLSEVTLMVVELSHHITYLLVTELHHCPPASKSLIEPYKVNRSLLEVETECQRLRSMSMDEVKPQILVDICGRISRYLTQLTECCRHASEQLAQDDDFFAREQFKLCVKSVAASASALITSIKCYRNDPTEIHFYRFKTFCDPLVSCCQGLARYCLEPAFTGSAAQVTNGAKEVQAEIFGACMNLVAANMQICMKVRELATNTQDNQVQLRLASCSDLVNQAAACLTEVVLRRRPRSGVVSVFSPPPLPGSALALATPGVSPTHAVAFYKIPAVSKKSHMNAHSERSDQHYLPKHQRQSTVPSPTSVSALSDPPLMSSNELPDLSMLRSSSAKMAQSHSQPMINAAAGQLRAPSSHSGRAVSASVSVSSHLSSFATSSSYPSSAPSADLRSGYLSKAAKAATPLRVTTGAEYDGSRQSSQYSPNHVGHDFGPSSLLKAKLQVGGANRSSNFTASASSINTSPNDSNNQSHLNDGSRMLNSVENNYGTYDDRIEAMSHSGRVAAYGVPNGTGGKHLLAVSKAH